MKEIEKSVRANNSLLQKSAMPSAHNTINKTNIIMTTISLSNDTLPVVSSSPLISNVTDEVLVPQANSVPKNSNKINDILRPNCISDGVIWEYYELLKNRVLRSTNILCMSPIVCHAVKSLDD